MITVHIYRTKNAEYAYRVKTANGKIVFDSAESYKTRQGVRRALVRLAEMASTKLGAFGGGETELGKACHAELTREEAEHAAR